MPTVVFQSLDNVVPGRGGIVHLDGGSIDAVGYTFDLSQFSAPNTVTLTYNAAGNLPAGRAFLEVGGGSNSKFDYYVNIVGSMGSSSTFGINVVGAKSFHLMNAGALYVQGSAALNAPNLDALNIEGNSSFHVEARPGIDATVTALNVGGGVIKNSGRIEAIGPTAYGIHVKAVSHNSPVVIETGQITSDDGDAGAARSYGVAVDWSANIRVTGDIVADNGVVFDGDPEDGSASINLINNATITGRVSLSPGGDSYDGRFGVIQGWLFAGEGADTLAGGQGDERFDAGGGNDVVNGGQGDDLIVDSSGSNYLRGDEGNDSISGGTGFDDINGNLGADTAHGNDGADWVVGGKDADLLFGDAGDDIVYGNMGDDTCEGGEGADIVRGGQGNDTISGGVGNDWMSGDLGDDTISGGAGADTFHAFKGVGLDRVTDFNLAEGDKVLLDAGTTYTVRQSGSDTVVDLGGGDQVVLVGVQAASLTGNWIFVG